MKTRVPTLLLILLCVAAVTNSYAATLTVTKTADTSDGVCDSDCSLRDAVMAAVSGDTLVFSTLFNSPQTITLTDGQITIDKSLTITGTGQDLVTVSGNNASRVLFISGEGISVNISGITFRDGNVGSPIPYGGAIAVDNGHLSVSFATFTNNRAVDPQSSRGNGAAIWGAENSSLTLSDLLVFGNNSAESGGSAISSHSVEIRNSIVKENIGGGIGADTGHIETCLVSDNTVGGVLGQWLTVIDSSITNNRTLGGVWTGNSSSMLSIDRCLISGNSSFRTGGGIASSGITTIRDSEITRNRANAGWGGGIANEGDLYLVNSVVSGNISSFSGLNVDGGGGVSHRSGTLIVSNSTISGNTAGGVPGAGGGIFVSSQNAGRVYLVNSTIADNTSLGTGGGISLGNKGVGTVANTIVAENNSTGTPQEDVAGAVVSKGINLIGNTTGSSGWIGGDLLNMNAMLAPLGNNGGSTFTHALLPGSPAIDGGSNMLAVDPMTMLPLTQDQRGRHRFVGGMIPTVDIGAYESSYSLSPVFVSGRITNYSGRGIERTCIKIDDGQGNVFCTQTNPFGYYRLNNLVPGTSYTLTVTHKLYLFTSPQIFTAEQDRSDLNFVTGL
jgi:CSLREA domain-containing protein